LFFCRDQLVANLLVVGDVDMAVGGASHGLSAALATRHLLHIQHQLGSYFIQIENNNVFIHVLVPVN